MTAEKKSVYALVLTELHQYEKADKLYNELIKEYPDNIEYRLGLANLLFMNHKPQARAHYQWVLEHADTDAIKSRALQRLGRIAASEGDLSRSRDLLQQALKLNSKSAGIHRDMIVTYTRLKQFDQALQQLEDAEKLGIRIPSRLKNELEESRRTSNQISGGR
jgi:tetratricopeptide (TPR) repeat protein